MTWTETAPPMSAMLPATRYFEVDSDHCGAKFGVWVTTPTQYSAEPEAVYPAVYQPDGNVSAPLTAPATSMLGYDPICPIQPFIQVCVGYVGVDSERALAVRARDLLPPGEPLPTGLDEAAMDAIVQLGLLDADGAKLYLENLRSPAADRFVAFLTDELHPLIAAEFRVDGSNCGLFGYSYGGLFATYAALRRTMFRRVGAGSPGILGGASKVFELYDTEVANQADHSGRMLHMTVGEKEITAPSEYQYMVASGASAFIRRSGEQPLKGLAFTSQIIPAESHATGQAASWFSFLRTCYPATVGPTRIL